MDGTRTCGLTPRACSGTAFSSAPIVVFCPLPQGAGHPPACFQVQCCWVKGSGRFCSAGGRSLPCEMGVVTLDCGLWAHALYNLVNILINVAPKASCLIFMYTHIFIAIRTVIKYQIPKTWTQWEVGFSRGRLVSSQTRGG